MRSLAAFTRFELGRLLRSWRFLGVTVGFPVVFYLLFLNNHPAGRIIYDTVSWRTYLMVSMCSFGAMVAALNASSTRLTTERSNGWSRQLRVTPLPAWSYVTTKVSVSMLVVLPVVVLVEVVGVAFGGVRLSAAAWFGLTVLMWATALPFAVLGVLIGFLASAETIYPVIMGLMFVLGYFGGLFVPVSHMPAALRTVAQVFPSFQHASLGFDLLGGRALAPEHWLVLAAYAVGMGGLILWKHRVEEARGLA
jgi:ABC-2 type transport system permease protein